MDIELKKKKEKRKKIILYSAAAAVFLLLVFLPFLVEDSASSSEASILSGTVERSSISRTLSGAGTLASADSIEVTVPEGVEIIGYAVAEGDMVNEGDPVAYVDKVSVMEAAALVSDSLESVEDSMHDAEGELVSTYIYSNVAGTVKTVYAKAGDNVREVMLEHDCLAEIELAGGGTIKVTGVSGTVQSVNIQEGRTVYDGAVMFTLKDVDSTGEYATLIGTHQKYEEILAQLYQMNADGYVRATGTGMISGVDETLISGYGKFYATNVSAGDKSYESTYVNAEISQNPDKYLKVIQSVGDIQAVELNFTNFPSAKKGDTAIVQVVKTFIELPNGQLELEQTTYTVVSVVSSKTDSGTESGKTDDDTTGGSKTDGDKPGVNTAGGSKAGSGATNGSQNGNSTTEVETLFSTDGTVIAEVIPMDTMTIDITVDELDILTISEGDIAVVTIDALPGRSFEGTVTGVNTGSSNNGGNSKYAAEITLERTDDMLSGMNASGLITIETVENILTIPEEALSEEGTKTIVYTSYDEKSNTLGDPVEVETGIADGSTVEIKSGLSDGQSIWYSYYDIVEIDGLNSGSGFNIDSMFGGGGGGGRGGGPGGR